MLEVLFNVDPGALPGARLVFAVSWPVLGALAAGAVLVALVSSGYLGAFGRRSMPAPGRHPVLAFLRGALALVVVFVLARPELVVRAPAHDGAAVLVLVDQSLSMGIADGPGAATRGEQAASLLRPLTGSLARELEARFQLRYQGFAAGLQPPGHRSQEGDGAVSDTLGALLEAVRSQRLAGVVMAGDGGQVAAPWTVIPWTSRSGSRPGASTAGPSLSRPATTVCWWGRPPRW